MNNISEPNNAEVRGWVMLMLERASETVNPSECDDPAVLFACALDAEGENCPAKCREDAKEQTEDGKKPIVKAGDLAISATAAEGKKVLLNGGTSDLDTITLKASEAITVNSITLERYGFSSYKDVANVWLENADGVKIANEKSISSTKDTVTLNLKKEYKTFEDDDTITIVLETKDGVVAGAYPDTTKVGTSIGFKVTAVDSSAKNLDISNYSPYLYDMIAYDGSDVTVTKKGKDTKYHYNADEVYEVARFQVKASNSAVKVDGFTLTNVAGTNKLDVDRYLDNVVVSLNDGTELKNVKYEANKDDELKVTFDAVEIAINKSVIFVVEIGLKELDKFNTNIQFQLAKSSDVNVKEQKNDVRANVTLTAAVSGKLDLFTYTFQGGKIEVSNEKLSDNIDAGAGSSDVVIGKGKITVPESVKLNDFAIVVVDAATTLDPDKAIETFKMVIGNEEFDGTVEAGHSAATGAKYIFSNVTIDESDTIEFVVDLKDETSPATLRGTTLTFDAFDKARVKGANANLGRYEDARQDILDADWAGSVSLSKIRIQEAKGSLSNTTKDQEYLVNQTARKTIFEGTYTAQKQDVNLSEFGVRLSATHATAEPEITYYLSIGGKEVGSFEYDAAIDNSGTVVGLSDVAYLNAYAEQFSNVLVKKGEKVDVKLEANVRGTAAEVYSPILVLRGEDKDGNNVGLASEYSAKIKVVTAGSVTVSDDVTILNESVEVADNNVTIAKFIVKSSKNTEGMELNNFTLTWVAGNITTSAGVRVKVADQELVADVDYVLGGAGKDIVVTGLSEPIPSEGVVVEVIAKTAAAGQTYTYTLNNVNGSNPGTKFSKKVLASVASIKAQENRGDSTTKFTFAVDKDSTNTAVKNLVLYTKIASGDYVALNATPVSTVEEGTTLEVINASSVQFVDAIAWGASAPTVAGSTITADVIIEKTNFRDFFKVGDADAQVFRTK